MADGDPVRRVAGRGLPGRATRAAAVTGAALAAAVAVLAAAAAAERDLLLAGQQRAAALGHHAQRGGHTRRLDLVLVDVRGDDLTEHRQLLLRGALEGAGDAVGEAALAGRVDVGDGGHGHLLDLLAGGPLDLLEQEALTRGHEEHGVALTAGAAGAADAVHVGLGVLRDVVVDHVRDALDVQAAGGDVGGHEDVHAAGLQVLDGLLALLLGDVAGDGHGLEPGARELLGELLGAGTGAHEGDDAVVLLGLEDPAQGLELPLVAHLQVALADGGGRRRLTGDGHLLRGVQVLGGDAADGRGHGGGEQRGLLRVRGGGEDAVHLLREAHAQHLVRLVQHEGLQVGEVQRAALEVVDHAARRADDDLRAPAQARQLRTVRGAAVHGQHGDVVEVLGVAVEGVGHLEGELAGRGEREHLRGVRAPGHVRGLGEAGQGRQRERAGLAGAGLGQAHDVAAVQQQRDGRLLDRRGAGVAQVLDGGQHAGVQAEVQEGGAGGPGRGLGGGGLGGVDLRDGPGGLLLRLGELGGDGLRLGGGLHGRGGRDLGGGLGIEDVGHGSSWGDARAHAGGRRSRVDVVGRRGQLGQMIPSTRQPPRATTFVARTHICTDICSPAWHTRPRSLITGGETGSGQPSLRHRTRGRAVPSDTPAAHRPGR